MNWLQELQNELKSSVELIDNKIEKTSSILFNSDSNSSVFFENSDSILDTCNKLIGLLESKKSELKIIHHLACSGGSLITKCFSAMPNVFILSEVHPHSYRHLKKDMATFLPSDISTLAKQAGFRESYELAKKIFRLSIKEASSRVTDRGGVLILRDHSRSDFCVGDSYTDKSTVTELLLDDFDIIPLVTACNPIDCYLSLQSNYWLHFEPQTFNEYCLRFLNFLAQFKKNQIVKYESFTRSSDKVMKKMCNLLEVQYDESYKLIFDQFKVTGDSGRVGVKIEARPRREISDELKNEINKSKNFAYLC